MPNCTNVEKQKIFARDFGIIPDTAKDYAPAFITLFAALRQKNTPVELVFDPGRYDVHWETAFKKEIFISNSMTYEECGDHPEHRIAMPLEGLHDLTIFGNGAEIIAHGSLMYMLLENCENIKIQDMVFDFQTPSIAELDVLAVDADSVTYKIHNECPYYIEQGVLYFKGETFLYKTTDTLPCSAQRKRGDRVERIFNIFSRVLRAEEAGDRTVRVHYSEKPDFEKGDTIQFRQTKRTEVGFLSLHSKNISFDGVKTHYMHGLGMFGQFSENMNFTNMFFAPRKDSERTASAFADFMHFSMCRGKISIKDSYYSGAHDDVINIHGVHLKVISSSGNKAVARFMHGETFGFQAFFPGDRVDFIDGAGLFSHGEAAVTSVKMLDLYNQEITFDRDISALAKNAALENISWIAEAEISGNYFQLIPTRGILYASRGKCVIRDNTFHKMHMSAVLIADDAASWYESGMVTDVTIKNNTFIECDDIAVLIKPENTLIDKNKPVHTNIAIEGNTFSLKGSAAVSAKSTKGLRITGNTAEGSTGGKPLISLLAVTDELISDNDFHADSAEIARE